MACVHLPYCLLLATTTFRVTCQVVISGSIFFLWFRAIWLALSFAQKIGNFPCFRFIPNGYSASHPLLLLLLVGSYIIGYLFSVEFSQLKNKYYRNPFFCPEFLFVFGSGELFPKRCDFKPTFAYLVFKYWTTILYSLSTYYTILPKNSEKSAINFWYSGFAFTGCEYLSGPVQPRSQLLFVACPVLRACCWFLPGNLRFIGPSTSLAAAAWRQNFPSPRNSSKILSHILLWASLAVFVASAFLLGEGKWFFGLWALPAVIGTLLWLKEGWTFFIHKLLCLKTCCVHWQDSLPTIFIALDCTFFDAHHTCRICRQKHKAGVNRSKFFAFLAKLSICRKKDSRPKHSQKNDNPFHSFDFASRFGSLSIARRIPVSFLSFAQRRRRVQPAKNARLSAGTGLPRQLQRRRKRRTDTLPFGNCES